VRRHAADFHDEIADLAAAGGGVLRIPVDVEIVDPLHLPPSVTVAREVACASCPRHTTWIWTDECWRCAKRRHAHEDAADHIVLNTPDAVRAVLEGNVDPDPLARVAR
jgi:hypothetical protein